MKEFYRGIKDGIPICLGYFTIAVTFGLLVKSNEIPSYVGWLMSIFVFAGASQFVAIDMIKNASILEIGLTTFFLNLRHILMSSTIATKMPKDKKNILLSLGITDETFSVSYFNNPKRISFEYLSGVILISYFGWIIGTIIGTEFYSLFSTDLQNSLGIALYAMFVSILIPNLKKSLLPSLSVLSSIIIYIFLKSFIPKYYSIIITSILVSFVFSILEGDEDE
ncbi:putative branched-chain amino acid permease (azaleucine resistance) [Marinitoga piezophila KA3]|uniref:Putative branched-chain amino acid permease (Azaleucine resistance) n=1 Tax=Marinitoga piezophila (strain DSM 14283 / JCM 11233 / KA3) TaxID=443254 RepID=H2J764_MARPK|nr:MULTISPECIES: AzlC family ABC transporter permease [Marinitoga]AEX86434.1 putative branched-chain amino acid permease (azaleucine resistance) [Marinitoga piezophila KA3]APT76822.1 hypothetical protein LN42_10875 [Marinitoga sp. 1137]